MPTIFITLILAPLMAFAQTVDVKGVETGKDDSTTIEIRKGKQVKEGLAEWEVSEGTSDIEGDTGAINNEARTNWKKACEDWKKEFRQDNKENKIINISCGTPTCSGETGSKTCRSTATYKVKTKVN